MPSPLPEVLKGLQRFTPGLNDVTPEESEPFLYHNPRGAWVRLRDVVAALRGEEGEAGLREELLAYCAEQIETADYLLAVCSSEGARDIAGGAKVAIEQLRDKVADRSSPGLSGGDYAEEQNSPVPKAVTGNTTREERR